MRKRRDFFRENKFLLVFLGVLLVVVGLFISGFDLSLIGLAGLERDYGEEYEIIYFHTDHLGSPVVKTNQQGEVVWSVDYKPFGEAFNEVGDNKLKYNVKELDEDTGLYYYGARYYDANTGRFITADTVKGSITDPQSLNRYVYVKNNPMKYIDPSGNQGELYDLESGVMTTNDLRMLTALGLGDVPRSLTSFNFEENINSHSKLTADTLHAWGANLEDKKLLSVYNAIKDSFVSFDLDMGEQFHLKLKGPTKFPLPLPLLSISASVTEDVIASVAGRSVTYNTADEAYISSYALRIDKGQVRLEQGLVTGAITKLGSLFISQAKLPPIEKAKYLITLGGDYLQVFGIQEGELQALDEIRCVKTNKIIDISDLSQEKQSIYSNLVGKMYEDYESRK